MNFNPLVTALICNYNYGRYLSDAIESALNQTWENMEIIVVDDGSTDDSREILKKYEGRIRIILKENGGQASAFNAGIAEARGDIICFLDSDDFWYPEKVALIVDKYKEAPWGLICNDLYEVNEKGIKISNNNYSQTNDVSLQSGNVFEYILEHGFNWVFSPTSGLSVTIEVAKKIFPLPEKEWRICADGPVAYGAMCHAPVGVISEPLGDYRLHDSNLFASIRRNNIISRITKITNQAERFLFLKDYLSRTRKNELKKDLKNFYPYYRSCCFITRNQPWHYLITLWERNIQHHFKNRTNILVPILNTLKYLFLDSVVSLLMFLHFPTPYQQLREYYRQVAPGLNPSTRDYLEYD
jgi:glycosyltransferase involved in cell wall biosynthesis